jgi:hypothetical protein
MEKYTSLKERLSVWSSWDITSYEVGACLGFWPNFGALPGNDPWHGIKGVIWSSNILGDSINVFISALVDEGMLEKRDDPDIEFRWNINYSKPL